MSEKIKNLEVGEPGERSERRLERGGVEGRVHSTLEQMKLEKGLSPERAFRELTEGLAGWLSERIEDVGQVIEVARKAVGGTEFARSELGAKIVGGLEKAEKLCESGAEWVRGEKGQALIALLGLAFLSVINPLGPVEFLGANTDLLGHALGLLSA